MIGVPKTTLLLLRNELLDLDAIHSILLLDDISEALIGLILVYV